MGGEGAKRRSRCGNRLATVKRCSAVVLEALFGPILVAANA